MIHLYSQTYQNSTFIDADMVGSRYKPIGNWYKRTIAIIPNAEARRIVRAGAGEDTGFTSSEIQAISQCLRG